MKRLRRVLLITSILCANMLAISQPGAQETGFTYIERELDYLMSIWPGDYDNQEQVSFDARAEADQPLGGGRFHASVVAVQAPAIGEHLLYVEISAEGDLNEIYTQRLYALVADEAEKAIRVEAYTFKKPEKFYGAGRQAEKLAKLTRRDVIALADCDLLLRRSGNSFAGSNKPGGCKDGSKPGFLERSIRVSKDQYHFNDQRRLKQREGLLAGTVTPRVMQRARWFACMVDVPKDTPGRSNFTQHYIKIHDQGGAFDFTHPDGRKMTLLMRNTWSYGMQRETFFIGVFDGDVNGNMLVYSWGMPGADRIGMNPGWVRIQCDLDSPSNVELQQGLRAES